MKQWLILGVLIVLFSGCGGGGSSSGATTVQTPPPVVTTEQASSSGYGDLPVPPAAPTVALAK